VKIKKLLPYRYADAVLHHHDFMEAYREIEKVIAETTVPLLLPNTLGKGGVKRRTRGSKKDRFFFLPVDQKKLNAELDRRFTELGWQNQPLIVGKEQTAGPDTGLKGDFKKGRLHIEIQFGNMARWYTDVFKFQLSYALGTIDVAVLVVPTQEFSNLIDENVAYFERIERELPWAKMSLTLPILVMGVEPDDYAPIKTCYDAAANEFIASKKTSGEIVTSIPFSDRIHEEPLTDTDED
jgi:hypothetical protein